MWVYIYQSWTEKELQNAYIGEYPERWQPWVNTLFYASLNWNTNSEWTLNPTFNSQSWTITYPTTWNIQYAYLNSWKMVWDIWTPPTNTITFQTWVSWETAWCIAVWAISWGNNPHNVGIQLYFSWNQRAVYTQNNTSWYGLWDSSNANTWYLITWVKDGTTLTLYKNWASIWSVACASSFNQHTNLYIANNGASPISNVSMRVSDIILEDKARTAQEVADYYNLTKSNYWL